MLWLVWLAVAVALVLLARRFVPILIVDEGYVGLLYRNGRLVRSLRPGLHLAAGWRVRVDRVDTRRQLLEVSGQEVLTGDNVTVKLSLQAELRVVDALLAVRESAGWWSHVYTTLQLALRAAVAGRSFDEVMRDRAAIGSEIATAMAEGARAVGVELIAVHVRDVMLSAELRRAFAEAVRLREEGKAALEKARAESAALRSLANAARMLKDNPDLLNVRVLQSIEAVGTRPGSTLVVGAPYGLPGFDNTRGVATSGPNGGP